MKRETAQLIHGDCIEVMRSLPNGFADAVITDPPYGMDFQSSMRKATPQFAKIANDKKPFIWWLAEAYRVLKDGSAMYCFCDWRNAETFRLAIETAGFCVKSQAIWDREAHGMGDLKGSLAPRHDVIWFATKGRFQFPGKRPTSIFRSLRVNGGKLVHPNEKPTDLMRQLVGSITIPNAVILDPFMGSGTTGVAAINTGRRFIGIERDEGFFAVSTERLAEAATKVPLAIPSLSGLLAQVPSELSPPVHYGASRPIQIEQLEELRR